MSDAIAADWELAAADAGVGPTTVVLYPLPATGNHGAMYFPPGLWPHAYDSNFVYTEELWQELYERRDGRILVIDESLAPPKRLLVLRHEAEHVAQIDAAVAVGRVGLWLAVSVPNDWIYLAMPHERDADAAATAIAAANRIEATQSDREGSDRFLYAAPWSPPNRESLSLRLLAFTLFYPDEFDDACRTNQAWPNEDPDEIIEALIPGGTAARTAMRDRFRGFLDELTDHGISQQEWDSMGRPKRNALSDRLRAQLVDAEVEAAEELRVLLALT